MAGIQSLWRLYIRIDFFDKVQATRTNCNEIGIYTTSVYATSVNVLKTNFTIGVNHKWLED